MTAAATPDAADRVPIRGLSLTQPWASLVAIGAKRIETRSWSTHYRGLVAIHAAKGMDAAAREFCLEDDVAFSLLHGLLRVPPSIAAKQLPRGAIVAIADLYDCRAMDRMFGANNEFIAEEVWVADLSAQERALGNYNAGRFGFFLRSIVKLPTPVPCRGALGLWELPEQVRIDIDFLRKIHQDGRDREKAGTT